jgi:ABC-type lipoprotein export system ATPase subunit
MAEPSPLIQIRDLSKGAGLATPFRIRSLDVAVTDRVIIRGVERPLAELLIHLITGAAVPDEGVVRIAGADTRSIATDTEWLGSLDRFGLVSDRAVLLDSLPAAANVALPLTLAIEPMSAETRHAVDLLADEVGLAPRLLDQPMASLGALDRLRVHLARALANGPELLLLEAPTSALSDAASSEDFGRTLDRLSKDRPIGWLAISNDQAFVAGSGGRVLDFELATGRLRRPNRWWPWRR